MTDYIINPVLMGSLVKEAGPEGVKVHLHGRLGVITVPWKLVLTGEELDEVYGMPFTREYHPMYEKDGGVPAETAANAST